MADTYSEVQWAVIDEDPQAGADGAIYLADDEPDAMRYFLSETARARGRYAVQLVKRTVTYGDWEPA